MNLRQIHQPAGEHLIGNLLRHRRIVGDGNDGRFVALGDERRL
jgi:hypothetical protein